MKTCPVCNKWIWFFQIALKVLGELVHYPKCYFEVMNERYKQAD